MEFFPPEVLIKILRVLETNDALNFRLVNQSWKTAFYEAVRLYRSPILQRLNATNIPTYIKFTKKYKPEICFPSYLVFETASGPPSGRSIFSRGYWKPLLKNVTKLIKHFGPDSIQALSFYKIGSQKDKKIFRKLCFLVAPSLKELKVEISWIIPFDSKATSDDHLYPEFPKLKKLSLITLYSSGQALLDNILERSPNLHTLEITSIEYIDISAVHLAKLKSLRVHCLKAAVRLPQNNILGESMTQPLQLSTLEIFYPRAAVFDEKVAEYIRCFKQVATTLNSLTIVLYSNPDMEHWPVELYFYLPFPKLPKLEHLAFKLAGTPKRAIFINPETINFNARTFPVLKSFELHLGMYLSTDSRFMDTNISRFPPGIKGLTLHVDSTAEERVHCPIEYRRHRIWMNLRNYIQYLYCIFPNIKRIYLVNTGVNLNVDVMIVPEGAFVEDRGDMFLRRVLKELLLRYPYLPTPFEIRVRNCSRDMLRSVGSEIEIQDLSTPEIRAELSVGGQVLNLEYTLQVQGYVNDPRRGISEFDNLAGRFDFNFNARIGI